MLPALRDGTPLCLVEKFAREPLAWPKLWKHHGAQAQTDRINAVARERKEPFLARYGGTIGLEWFFPKMLETLEHAPRVLRRRGSLAGSGRLVRLATRRRRRGDAPALDLPGRLQRHVERERRLSRARHFCARCIRSSDASCTDKMPGRLLAPGVAAGGLQREMAKKLGLAAKASRSAPRSSTRMPACPARARRNRGRSSWCSAPVPATCSTASTSASCPASRASCATASCPDSSATKPARPRSATPSTGCAA